MKSLREIWRYATSSDIPTKRKYTKRVEPSRIMNRTWTKVTNNDKKKVLSLRKRGWTYSKISHKMGRSTSTVSDIINSTKKYTVQSQPSNPKAVYQRHQDRLSTGNMEFLPDHHLCPVCHPNSKTTWPEYFAMTHRATIRNARKTHKSSSDFSLSNY
jgi:hypothetical protein